MSAEPIPRLRVFAGPNGSDKSTLIFQLQQHVNLYHIINPDDLLRSLERTRTIDLKTYEIRAGTKDFRSFVQRSTYAPDVKRQVLAAQVRPDQIEFPSVRINAHCVALLAAYLRDRLLASGLSFTFESVFSHPSKVLELQYAKDLGYRVYVYFIATAAPTINVKRVDLRVAQGGHDVPHEKIRSRYAASLANLVPALRICHRAYIFDNSGDESRWIAEVTPKGSLLIRSATVPVWFKKHVLEVLKSAS
jgi:predicted ABC-type ATPase